MEYLGSDPEKGHLFRCPGDSCHLKHKVHWSCYCDCEVWEKPEGKLLRIIGLLPRFTDEWKRIYRMQVTIERYSRSTKHSRLLNRHQCLGIAKVSLHVKHCPAGLPGHGAGPPQSGRLRGGAAREGEAAESKARCHWHQPAKVEQGCRALAATTASRLRRG